MAIPLIILGAAAIATAVGGKKAYKGYQDKSEANEILEGAKNRYDSRKKAFDIVNDDASSKLERLGKKELRIGEEFREFDTIAKELLAKMEQDGHTQLRLEIPQHRLNKIEKLAISATEYLGTVVGAGTSGAAAGFAVYSGVVAFAAASTGTPIAALSGAAAYNATMAAIGGGSLAAGGWGMAGGAMVLGGAVVAPILMIAGWAYAAHAEKALENAQDVARQVRSAVDKMNLAESHLKVVNKYVDSIYTSLSQLHTLFATYFTPLKEMHQKILERRNNNIQDAIEDSEECLRMIENGYMLAAIMTDVITTPLFKPVTNEKNEAVIENGVVQLQTDTDGINVLNKHALDKALAKSEVDSAKYTLKA
ncbi:chemotaxis protein [Rahnella sp. CJA17(1/100)]|uniref:chemotaxis protein n=1 Tax=Rahnella sp. CJA17(1/100) TaxID=2508951 RepID=UPI0010700D22|nr:chemotaxis protein [Rahnella sp. CJA17(1/100)]